MYFALTGRAPFEGGDVINKIYKQRLEDPEPLESVARGVPAAFAAVVRKLMSKNPAERHQRCAELRADLARWTDPARVQAILGAEAEAVRSFHPPAPQLEEDELRRWDDDEDRQSDGISLRDLGTAEPSLAPRHARPLPPLKAVVRPTPGQDAESSPFERLGHDDSQWLIHFAIIAAVAGLLAIVFLAIFFRL
jgi:eukaryotic-like serine/threonine-protein kinase